MWNVAASASWLAPREQDRHICLPRWLDRKWKSGVCLAAWLSVADIRQEAASRQSPSSARHRRNRSLSPQIYTEYLQDIVNIAKIHRQYSWDVRGWSSVIKEGIFLSVDPTKKKNKSTSDPSSRSSEGRFYGQSQWSFCRGCLKFYEHSKIHTYQVYISFKWRVEKDNIDLR